mgnify:CR=1 FL=1
MLFAARVFVFFQAEDGIRDLVRSRGLGDVYKRQDPRDAEHGEARVQRAKRKGVYGAFNDGNRMPKKLSLIHI